MATRQGVDKAARPVALTVQADGIPGEVKALKRWVLWRYEWDEGKGWSKPPLGLEKGHRTSVRRPGGWGTFTLAVAGLERGRGNADGIGIVLSSGPDDPLDLAGIDIDDPALIPLLGPLATYTEATPTTGKGGARALFRGKLPAGYTCRAAGAEAYESGRYFTVTGRRLGDSPQTLARPDPDTLATVLRSLGLLGTTSAPGPAPPPPVGAVGAVGAQTARAGTFMRIDLDGQSQDDLLLQAAYRSKTGADIRRLMEGDMTGYEGPDGAPDHSRADMALVNHLEFYFRDEAAIDRVFRTSGLMRPKWDVVCYASGETYGQHCIRDAIKSAGAHYGDRRRRANGEAVGDQAPTTPTAPTAPTGGGGVGPGAHGTPRPGANGQAPAQGVPVLGRLASEVTEEALEWFLEPWVARCMLTLVAGKPSAGKSTFLAHLASRARRVVYLPGPEEYVPAMTLRRLRAAGVSLAGVRLLDDRRYSLVDDAQALCRQIRADGADLLLIDPVDSFFPPAWSENDGAQVREVLESVEKIARESRCAAVGVRHPGKSAENVMRGSQAWGAVPRAVLHLVCDDGPPVRRLMHARKWGFPGTPPADRFFEIVGPEGAPGVWREAGAAGRGLSELLTVEADPVTRTQVELACEFIKRMLAEGEAEVAWMLALGRNQGYPEATMQRAKRLLGVTTRHDGHGRNSAHWWVPPATWPD